jgi:hypothetical protein
VGAGQIATGIGDQQFIEELSASDGQDAENDREGDKQGASPSVTIRRRSEARQGFFLVPDGKRGRIAGFLSCSEGVIGGRAFIFEVRLAFDFVVLFDKIIINDIIGKNDKARSVKLLNHLQRITENERLVL